MPGATEKGCGRAHEGGRERRGERSNEEGEEESNAARRDTNRCAGVPYMTQVVYCAQLHHRRRERVKRGDENDGKRVEGHTLQ